MKKIIIAATGALLFAILSFPASSAVGEESRDRDLFHRLQKEIIRISEEVKPQVVHIEAFVRTHQKTNKTLGSGVVCSDSGYIITNHHVIFRGEKITVRFPASKKRYSARIVGSDPLTDIAVLKINPDAPLTVPPFGDSKKVKVGEWVLAVGNPFGLDGTVSFGIISAKGRDLEVAQINEFLQTDAMIDPGSSGGALVNLKGEVIGINSMIVGRGIGFTIPINTALEIKDSIIKEGEFERGWLGISMTPLTQDLADYFGLSGKKGIIITAVMKDTPAWRAGLQVGDIITRFDKKVVEAEYEEDLKNFQRMITGTKVDRELKILILREGQPLELPVTLTRYPKISSNEQETTLGFNVMEITNEIYLASRLDSKEGVLVSYVESGSPADEANLTEGDIIFWVEGRKVSRFKDFLPAIEKAQEKETFLIKSLRGKTLVFNLFKKGQ